MNALWFNSQNNVQPIPNPVEILTKDGKPGPFWRCINDLIVEKSNAIEKKYNIIYSVNNVVRSTTVDTVVGTDKQGKEIKENSVLIDTTSKKPVLKTVEKNEYVNLSGLIEHKLWVSGYEHKAVGEHDGLKKLLLISSAYGDKKNHWIFLKKKFTKLEVEGSAEIVLKVIDQQRTFTDKLMDLTNEEKLSRLFFKEMIQNCTLKQLEEIQSSMQAMESNLKPVQITAIKAKSIFQSTVKIIAQISQNVIFRLSLAFFLAYKVYYTVVEPTFIVATIFVIPAMIDAAKRNLPSVVYSVGKNVYEYKSLLWLAGFITGSKVLMGPLSIMNKIKAIGLNVFFWVFANTLTTTQYFGKEVEKKIDASQKNKLVDDLKTAESYWILLSNNVDKKAITEIPKEPVLQIV